MKKNLFSLTVLLCAFYGTVYLSGWMGGLGFLMGCLMYLIIFYAGHRLIAFIRRRNQKEPLEFISYFAFRLSSLIVLLVVLIGFFVWYEDYQEPARLPEFTLSNGKKTVVFQGMQHIGSDAFYNKIMENIKEKKKDGYVLFYEGVKLGKKENMDKFDSLLGVQFDKQTYTSLSKLYGLRAQNNKDFLGLINDKDYNTDISMDDIISKYESKYGKIDSSKESSGKMKAPVQVGAYVDDIVKQMTDRELQLLMKINRAIMNMIVKNDNIRSGILSVSGQEKLFDVILNDRNKVIVKSIEESDSDKIYILYGLMHFNGVWSSLQEHDPNWHLQSIRYFIPIE